MALYNTTTTKEFEEKVTKSKKVVLVDFWAQWCPPCRAMAPILESVAKKMDADVDIVKVDIEATNDNKQLAAQFKVQSIPNMVIFAKGVPAGTLIGMLPEPALHDELKKHL
ncbi:MAG: thioredoxin [Candidatus Saccharimonas sp.]